MSDEAESKDKKAEGEGLMETLRVIVQALLLAGGVHIFLFQPFTIPSGSMIPTLLVGDYLFVSKFSYGYSKYSLPWSPDLFDGRIIGSKPEHGDVAVFKLPRDNKTDYIKRVVGVPGDQVQMVGGVLHLNGEPVKRERIEDFTGPGSTCNVHHRQEIQVPRYIETLPNGASYETLDCAPGTDGDDTELLLVPEGHYMMMGDNRDNSTDSRFGGYSGVGFVPYDNFVGRAEIIFFSVDETASWFTPWRWLLDLRWSRFFEWIR